MAEQLMRMAMAVVGLLCDPARRQVEMLNAFGVT